MSEVAEVGNLLTHTPLYSRKPAPTGCFIIATYIGPPQFFSHPSIIINRQMATFGEEDALNFATRHDLFAHIFLR